MELYNFFRSGTSHRLRIALNFKGVDYEYIAVDLRREEHLSPNFRAINPQGLVPALVDKEMTLIQSPAILEWLEERYPEPPLLPQDPSGRHRVRALSALIGCDIHPVNNRRILEYLRKEIGASETAVEAWCQRWIKDGFDAFESLLAEDHENHDFCYGDAPTLADVYLVPQVESARRFNVDLSPYPRIRAIDRKCGELAPFRLAAPPVQPDAPRTAG